MSDTDDLIAACLLGEASDDDARDLWSRIRSDTATAKEFARAAMLHAQLREQLSGEQQVRESGGIPVAVAEATDPVCGNGLRERIRRRMRPAVLTSLIAAIFILAAVTFHRTRSGLPETPSVTTGSDQAVTFATVGQTDDVARFGTRQLGTGERISESVIELSNGFVRLHFDSGVDLTLQGPAVCALHGPEKVRLTSGLLTAYVPPGAEGFIVDTPTAEVVDLGTSFGVDLRNEGSSEVSVFDGKVEIVVPNSRQKRLLTEGRSLRIRSDHAVEEIDFDPIPFEKLWPISSGIAGSSEIFRFVPPWPRRIRFIQSDTDVFVAAEGYPVDLAEALRVNISEPGRYEREDQLTPSELPANERVRSYVLHYSPTENLPPKQAARVTGSITFERPVLGLIVQHEELAASMSRFSARRLGESHERRRLNLTGAENGDRITLSEDRRTVTVDLISPRFGSDLVRIIVDRNRRNR